jgi:8-oxo-dGTP pyrophosphatase MutT (NUDIX family)
MLQGAELAASLREALDQQPSPTPGPDERMAAVLAPIVLDAGPSLIFTVRAEGLSRHAGEISFPGGLQDPGETLLETAIREANEEIGLVPASFEMLGSMSPIHASMSGILVVPFVALLPSMPSLRPSEAEIAEVLVLPVDRLAEVESLVEYDRPGGRTWRGYAYEVGGHTVWGVTGWVLHALLDTIRQETAWGIP